MKQKKNYKFIFMGLGFMILLSAFSIKAHILMVKHENKNKIPYQLSRIDIQSKLNPRKALSIKESIMQIQGVQNAILNEEEGILVFIHNKNTVSSKSIFDKITNEQNIIAKQHITDASAMQGSCPVSFNEDFSFKALYLSIFHNK
ncbi:MAG: hypothetical protein ACOVP1_03660 [Bacteroidia bacterium]